MNKIKDLICVVGTSLLFIAVYLMWVFIRKREERKGEKKGQEKRKKRGVQKKQAELYNFLKIKSYNKYER